MILGVLNKKSPRHMWGDDRGKLDRRIISGEYSSLDGQHEKQYKTGYL